MIKIILKTIIVKWAIGFVFRLLVSTIILGIALHFFNINIFDVIGKVLSFLHTPEFNKFFNEFWIGLDKGKQDLIHQTQNIHHIITTKN